MVNQKLFLPLHNQIQLNLTALKNAKGQQLTPAEMTKGDKRRSYRQYDNGSSAKRYLLEKLC